MGEVAIHEGVKVGVVTGFDEVAELVDDDVLDAPLGQQQQIEREADTTLLDMADSPGPHAGTGTL